MKRFFLAVCILFLISVPVRAQSHAEQIARATLAAPPSMQADAMVIRMAASNALTGLFQVHTCPR